MNANTVIDVVAFVDSAERRGVIFAGKLLSACLGRAAGEIAWPVRLQIRKRMEDTAPLPDGAVIVASLLSATDSLTAGLEEIEADWRRRLANFRALRHPVFVSNVFRNASEKVQDLDRALLLERIRRLNLLAIWLSHDLNVNIIDVDRVFADLGARWLGADFRLRSERAVHLWAYTTVWTVLSFGLDDIVDPTIQEKAKTLLGDRRNMEALVDQWSEKSAHSTTSPPSIEGALCT